MQTSAEFKFYNKIKTLLFFVSSWSRLTSFLFLSLFPEYLTELREYGTLYSSWAASEEELQRPLEGVASSVGTCSGSLEDLTENMSQDFLPVLREYVLYIESMKVRCSSCTLLFINFKRYFFGAWFKKMSFKP